MALFEYTVNTDSIEFKLGDVNHTMPKPLQYVKLSNDLSRVYVFSENNDIVFDAQYLPINGFTTMQDLYDDLKQYAVRSSGGGTSLQWYAENAAAPSVAPIATGTASIALGDGAEALSQDMFVYGTNAGVGASNAEDSVFIGNGAGFNATNSSESIFIGQNAGYDANDAEQSVFIGDGAGNTATKGAFSVFIGKSAGNSSDDASRSVFIGNDAGHDANNAEQSVFIGNTAGVTAADANNAIFIGAYAGYGANKSNNSIFIGNSAGNGDTVDNSIDGTSILIGDNTSTGGFKNSIALGEGAVNNRENQLFISNIIRYLTLELPTFDDDADAGANGLTTSEWYKTTGLGAAPLNVAGIVMVKQ